MPMYRPTYHFHMGFKAYTDLTVWQKGMSLVAAVYRATEFLPNHERYGLSSQLRRAAISIPSNIAEGYGRATRGEFLNHLSVARGSLYEVETLWHACNQLGFTKRGDWDAVK